MEYTKAVNAAAKALKTGEDANWELARLTWENTNSQTDRTKVKMEDWCRDVVKQSGRKFSRPMGDRYRKMWAVHGSLYKSTKLSWSDCWKMTIDDGNGGKRVSPTKVQKDIESWTPETKKAAIKKLVKDDVEAVHEEVKEQLDKTMLPPEPALPGEDLVEPINSAIIYLGKYHKALEARMMGEGIVEGLWKTLDIYEKQLSDIIEAKDKTIAMMRPSIPKE